MNPLTPSQISNLLDAAGQGSVVYLVGAGGCGMSALGHLLLDLGHQVAGSDLQVNPEIEQLRARGARLELGHDAGRLESERPVLVACTAAVRANNPELVRAQALGIPTVRRAHLLAALLQRQRGICVAGMHGKTTTSALLAFALEQLGPPASYAVGWLVPQLAQHGRFAPAPASGPAPWFVIEADESDGTLRDFRPQHAIILNVDAEHLDHFANLDAICREFDAFAAQTPGCVVFCADDTRLAVLLAQRTGAVSYGFDALAAYRIERRPSPGIGSEYASAFTVWHNGLRLGDFHLRLIGEHNIANATAAIALLHQLGYPPERIAPVIAEFRGAARRQQELFRDARFRVFDDYGHHPNEIRVTLRALQSLGGRRLLVAFQPHRYTRTLHLLPEFRTCFAGADKLWIGDIYAASEPEIPGVTSAHLAAEIRACGVDASHVPGFEELRRQVRAAMQPGDVVIFLGAGADITVTAHALASELRRAIPVATDQLHAELLAKLSPECVLRRDEPLSRKTTFRVGGRADFYVEPTSESDLAAVLLFCQAKGIPFRMLGRGSNLLVKDQGVRGMVISLAHPNFSRIEVVEQRLRCGAGAGLKQIANLARDHELGGLEFLEGIPGSLGGAMRMNAGAMGHWLFEVVEQIRLMDHDGRVTERPASGVNVEYRGCPLFKNHLALGAVLKGEPSSRPHIAERLRESNRKRWRAQPRQPSAGCIFKNPAAIPAGKLIDELGLKGARVGGAVVSDVHANFIVNDGQATAQDVLALIELIQQRARSARGIELETEVEIIGE
ncbi:MAG: UDP-N-acetylmuramate--L-alanine ligase [Verrucomicrobiota bacterium]